MASCGELELNCIIGNDNALSIQRSFILKIDLQLKYRRNIMFSTVRI